jgi:hypothetical protein
MKTILILTMLAATPALFAAETNAPAPSLLTNAMPALQVSLAEQADLVRQIGEDAARGFDAEAHARNLRAQIESLVTKPAITKPSVATEPPAASAQQTEATGKPSGSPAPGQVETAEGASTERPELTPLKEAVRKLRAMADELEAHVEKAARKP